MARLTLDPSPRFVTAAVMHFLLSQNNATVRLKCEIKLANCSNFNHNVVPSASYCMLGKVYSSFGFVAKLPLLDEKRVFSITIMFFEVIYDVPQVGSNSSYEKRSCLLCDCSDAQGMCT